MSTNVRQTLMRKSEYVWMASLMQFGKVKKVKPTKRPATLPIGPTARLAFEIDETRAACSKVAQLLLSQQPVNEAELEECARLDEALAAAHRLLKGTVRNIMLSRLKRSSRPRSR
jgi:hypothetical protein